MISQKSIAVLPFRNISSDPENEYFADGMSIEIINALSKIDGLKVTARTSSFAFKNRDQNVRIIGNELGVQTVLEGSIRKFRDRVRISAQLVRTDLGFQIWSESFDRHLSDIFELQDEISLLIADKIRENFGHLEIKDHLIDRPTDNIEAYNLYLKARHYHLKWNFEGISTAIKLYAECISIDPDFSLPYFGISFCYTMYGSWGVNKDLLKTAENYLQQGLELDAESYLGHFGKATFYFWGQWKYVEGQREYLRSIEINPSYTEAEEGLTELYIATGQFDQALNHARNILEIDPLSANHHFTIGNIYYLTRRYDKALECMQSALKIDPEFSHAVEWTQLCYLHLKQYQLLENFLEQHPGAERPEVILFLYKLLNSDHHEPEDQGQTEHLLNLEGVTLLPWRLFLRTHKGQHQQALDELESAVEQRQGQFINFMHHPLLDPLRKYDRFQALEKKTFKRENIPMSQAEEVRQDQHRNGLAEEDVEGIIRELSNLMETEKIFLDNSLTLRNLAEMVNLHPNKLSWLLNKHLGKNFNEYLNHFRVETFKSKALDTDNQHLTLLGLAYESGFNSKSVFNESFKKCTGLTPKQWLKKNR